MSQRARQIAIAAGLLGLLALSSEPPRADLRIALHDGADRAPQRFRAAFDLGRAGASVLVTWTARIR
jgi:hypothetical protein